MANITIPNLPAATSLNGDEQFETVQSGTSRRTTTPQIADYVVSAGIYGPISNSTVVSNISGATAEPTANTLTSIIDYSFGSTIGDILYRSGAGWAVLAPGISGQVLSTQGVNFDPIWRSTPGTGTVTSITAGTNLSATPANPITASGTISTVDNPVFATSTTTPLVIGGTAASSSLTLQSTSGTGTSDSLVFKTGSQVQAMTIGTAQTVKIGTGAASANANLYLTKEMTGSTTVYGLLSSGVVQSDVTSAAYGILDQIGTEAASFTLGSLQHYAAFQGTIGIGSQVTSQFGFNATANLIGAVNNYGFISGLPSVTTATISNVALTSNVVTITTSAAHGYGKGQSVIVVATINTAVNGTYTITSVPSTTTFTYALVSADIVSTADTGTAYVNTGRFNFYASGLAPNFFSGSLRVGGSNNTGGAAISSANPAFFKAGGAVTYTDIVSSGTVSNAFSSLFNGGTFAARLATTYTNATTVYIDNAPTAGTNVTITNPYALYSAAGDNYFGGEITSATSTTTPLLIGGTTASSSLTLQSTSGVGTTDSIAFKVGNNGATTGGTIGTTGNWGFGGNATTFIGLAVPLDITGATSAYGQRINGNVQSGVTTLAAAYFSNIALENASFTTTDLVHFLANPPSGGAGSTATNQYGFKANSTLGSNGAATVTNSYGFYSDLASATNKYNFYANGTATNYFGGNVGIGTTALTGYSLRAAKNITGDTSAYGVFSDGIIQSDVTANAYYYGTSASAVSGTLSTLRHYHARQASLGSATVTTQYGFVTDDSLIGATNNYAFLAGNTTAVTAGKTAYGFYSAVNTATGGGTTYQFYAAGTAPSVINGTVTLGTPLAVSSGGTGATTANAALTNLTTFTTTATAAGTTVLTNTSTYFQYFTGATTQTITLPVTSTLATGWSFHIVNNSTGNLTVNSSGGNLVITVLPGTTVMCTCILTSGTTAASWEAGYTDFSTATGTGSVVLATSPTVNNPTVTNYVESVVAIGTVTTASTLSLTNGTIQTATLTASTACTFTMPAIVAGKSFTLLLKQAAATGNGTATFTSVKWSSTGAPTITAAAGKMDILSFVSDGTNWYGSIIQGYTP